MIPLSLHILKHHPLTRVALALLHEFLILALLAFLGLFTLEILLPTFVSARVNLGVCFAIILFLFIFEHGFAHWLSQTFAPLPRFLGWIFVVLFVLFGVALIGLSLLKFPPVAGFILFAFIGAIAYFFRRLSFTV